MSSWLKWSVSPFVEIHPSLYLMGTVSVLPRPHWLLEERKKPPRSLWSIWEVGCKVRCLSGVTCGRWTPLQVIKSWARVLRMPVRTSGLVSEVLAFSSSCLNFSTSLSQDRNRLAQWLKRANYWKWLWDFLYKGLKEENKNFSRILNREGRDQNKL